MILRIVFSCQLSVVSYQLSVASRTSATESISRAFREPQCGTSMWLREPQPPRAFRDPQCGFENLSHREPQATVPALL